MSLLEEKSEDVIVVDEPRAPSEGGAPGQRCQSLMPVKVKPRQRNRNDVDGQFFQPVVLVS